MKKTYQHSKVFDSMKGTKEAIAGNYTSLQYLQTLDMFLWNSLEPIAAECPSLFKNYLAKIVARQTLKSSAKLTSDDRHKMPINLFNSLIQTDASKSFELSKLLYINRGLLFGFVSLFRNQLAYYKDLQRGHININPAIQSTLQFRIERAYGLRPNGNLYGALSQVEYWDSKAREFKAMIVQKYTRMAILQAQRTYKDFNHYVELDDVVQIYLVVVSRAIDRCDSRQGVLTTFIQNWFKSARGEVAKIAETQVDSSYEELTELHGDAAHTVLGVTDPDVDAELKSHIASVAKRVDPVGLVRTSLGIPVFVSRKHRETLEMFAVSSVF